MSSTSFPNPQTHDFPDRILAGEYFYDGRDIICLGNPLTLENVRRAYRLGIFPWHIEGMPLPWFCPSKRAILEFSGIHIAKSLEKERRRSKFEFTIDRDFRAVILNCSKVKRADQGGTWITPEFIEVYYKLHECGIAHSVEVWDETDGLVGGLYGVDAGGVFCGESMFHTASNASKLALLFLVEQLKERGSTWLDVQVMTPHLKTLGAKEIDRREFLKKLTDAQSLALKLFPA